MNDDDEAQLASIVQRMLARAATAAAPDSVVNQADDQAKFAAREFHARWLRETGETPSAVVTDRVLFAYEMGYLRGHGEGMRAATALFVEMKRKVDNDGDPK